MMVKEGDKSDKGDVMRWAEGSVMCTECNVLSPG